MRNEDLAVIVMLSTIICILLFTLTSTTVCGGGIY